MPIHRRKVQFNRKAVAWGSLIFFVVWRAFLIVHYEGWYAFDEMYHISSSNEEFFYLSQYTRAPYINNMIRLLSEVFGKSYYVYKLIPFLLSIVSVGVLLCVLYHLTTHTYSIIVFIFIICFHSVIIFNHLYIREYIWDEAVLSTLVLLLYLLSRAEALSGRIVLYILYICLSMSLMVMQQSSHWISLAVAVFGICAIVINGVLSKILPGLKKQQYKMIIFISIIIIFLVSEVLLIALRSGVIELPFSSNVINMIKKYEYQGYPYFTRNFYRGGIGLLIGVMAYGYYLVRYVDDYSNNIIGIYCLGVSPFIIYNMIWFDCFPMRIYASYLPVLVLVAVLGFDLFPNRIIYKCLIAGFCMLMIIKPQSGMHLKEYIRVPYIYNETNFNNYGGLVEETQNAIEDGRRCICIWSNEHQEAAFEIDAEYTIALENSINVANGYTRQDMDNLLRYLKNKNESYVLMIGPHCDWKIGVLREGFLEELITLYPYNKYDKNAYIFYIN